MDYYSFLFSPGHRLCLWGVTVANGKLEAELVYFGVNLPQVIKLGAIKNKPLLSVIVPPDARNSPVGGKATKIVFEVISDE